MDDRFDLVAGCFSRDPENTKKTAAELSVDPSRAYATWEEMAEREAALPEDQRIEAVSIVTPNHVHAGPAIGFMEKGFDVICDKPLCTTAEEAESIAAAVERTGRVFALTHNYTGHPLVRTTRIRVVDPLEGMIESMLTKPEEASSSSSSDQFPTPVVSRGGSLP